jgi:hypothetical protein
LEVKRRAEELLAAVRDAPLPPDALRGLRAVRVLETLGTKEARAVLAGLARGRPEARLTQEARAALGRLGR